MTVLLIAIFHILHIPCVTLAAFQKDPGRDGVQDSFNQDTESAMILITTYAVGATDLNLQERSRHIHIFECALNLGIHQQAVGSRSEDWQPSPVIVPHGVPHSGFIRRCRYVRSHSSCEFVEVAPS